MSRRRVSSILEVLAEISSLGTVVVPLVAIIGYRWYAQTDRDFDWNPFIAAFLLFLGVAEYFKRSTLLKAMALDIAALKAVSGDVKSHEDRQSLYKAIQQCRGRRVAFHNSGGRAGVSM